MGGPGSTRWLAHWKKTTVEECLTLDVFSLVGDIIPRRVFDDRQWWGGSIIWANTRTGEQTASVGYRLEFPGSEGAILRLNYTTTFPNGEKRESDYPIRLLTTRPNFGGVRWWFQCPLVINDRPCKRRVGKLYNPPGYTYFGCRHCYDLTYTSAQEAHKFDGLYAMLAAQMQDSYPGMTGREVGRVLNGRF